QKLAVLIGDNFNSEEVLNTIDALKENGVILEFIAPTLKEVAAEGGESIQPDKTFTNAHPSLYDAVYVAGGSASNQKQFDQHVKEYIYSHYNYFKPIGIASDQEMYLENIAEKDAAGVMCASDNNDFSQQFVNTIAQKRFWERS